MVSIRSPVGSYEGEHPEWLKVIWAANDAFPGTFGEPNVIEPRWAGGNVEEYDDARVIHRGDGSVSIVAKTDRGEAALTAAAEKLGIHINH